MDFEEASCTVFQDTHIPENVSTAFPTFHNSSDMTHETEVAKVQLS